MKQMENEIIFTYEEYKQIFDYISKKKEEDKKKKLCTSKKILIVSWSITIVLILVMIALVIFTEKDVTALATVVGVVTTATAVDTAFYSWKAKAENKIKIMSGMVESLADKYGIDSVVNLASIILAD